MSPRDRFVIIRALTIVGGLAILFAVSSLNSWLVTVAFLGWGVGGSYLMWRIRCPRCEVPIVYAGQFLGFSFYSGFKKSNCSNCGADLTSCNGE